MRLVLQFVFAAGLLGAVDIKKDAGPKVTAGEPSYDARIVSYHLGHAVLVNTQIRWTTTLILPSKEKTLDVMCGDKENWTVNALPGANYISVKPITPGLKTNLTVVMESGNTYIFVLRDVSQDPASHAETQVLIDLDDGAMISALNGKPKFVPADQVEAFRQEAETMKKERDAAQQALQKSQEEAKERERHRIATSERKTYHFDQAEASKQPFGVQDMWSTDGKTYIRAKPQEVPALYEMRDGKPSLLNYRFDKDVYVADSVIRSGYLAIGKARLPFKLSE